MRADAVTTPSACGNAVFLTAGVFSTMSGLWALLSQSWSLPYEINLFVHPAVSIAWGAVTFIAAIRRRGRRSGAVSGKQFAKIAALLLACAAPALFCFQSTAALVVGTVFAAGFGPLAWPSNAAKFANRALRFLAARLFFLALYSGIEIFIMGMGRGARAAFWLHRATSLAFLATAAAAVAAELADGRTAETARKIIRRARVPAFVAALFAFVIVVDANLGNPSYDLHLSTLPMAAREPGERIMPIAMARPELLDLTESCGKPKACHPAALEDHLKSVHNRSVMTPYFQKNLGLMVTEIGVENANLCAGCHHPQSLFDSRLNYEDFARRNNFSCVHCHVISGVGFPADQRRSIVRMTPNLRHLALLAPDATGQTPPFSRFAVSLYPDGHGRALNNDLLSSDDFCQACHRLQIRPTKETGFTRSRCIDCHMQPRRTLGLEGSGRNHRFPGSNTAVPYANHDSEQLEFTRRFIEGDFPLHLDAWGQVSALGGDTAIRRWLEMHYEPRTAPAAGERFQFVIWTANVGVDHAFPAAPLDLVEAWLEVLLTDSAGRVVFASGQPGADHVIPPDARRMGGYMIGEDGQIVRQNRVWQIAKKIIQRQVDFGQHTADHFEVSLPADVTGPLTLLATWNYRKLNQEFVHWAFGPGETIPIVRVAALQWKIPLSKPLVALPALGDELPPQTSSAREVSAAHP